MCLPPPPLRVGNQRREIETSLQVEMLMHTTYKSRGVRFAGWANISHIHTFLHFLDRSSTDRCMRRWMHRSIDRSNDRPTVRPSDLSANWIRQKHGQINRSVRACVCVCVRVSADRASSASFVRSKAKQSKAEQKWAINNLTDLTFLFLLKLLITSYE